MGRTDPRRVHKRHGERLTHLHAEMGAGAYQQALETLRRVLGDPQLPPRVRAEVTMKKVEVLIALCRPVEATVCISGVIGAVARHGFWDLQADLQFLMDKLAELQADSVGGIGV